MVMNKILLTLVMIGLTTTTPQVISEVKVKVKELSGSDLQNEEKMSIELDSSGRVAFWTPSLTKNYLSVYSGMLLLPNTEIKGYHALVTEHQQGKVIRTQTRYFFLEGRDIEASSDDLIAVVKSPLQIEPRVLPKPDTGYESSQPYTFSVSLDGEPLVNTPVLLETTNGSRLQGRTDLSGRVNFKLPDDFKHSSSEDSNAQFILSTVKQDNKLTYQTELILNYQKHKSSWLDLTKGLAWRAQSLRQLIS
jgi:hypothetical protein